MPRCVVPATPLPRGACSLRYEVKETAMRIAITGGTGYLGTALARALAVDGHEPFAVRRGRASDARAQWDPAAGWVRPGTFDGVDAVVHLSGTSIAAKRWTAERRAELRASRIESTRVLVDHLRGLDQPPKALVAASATGVYGESGDRVLTEESPRGEGFLADLVADWEREAMRASESGVRVAMVRLGPLVARDSELIGRLLLPFRVGLGGRLGGGRQWFSWVTTEDAVSAVEFLLTHDEVAGPVNVVAPQPATNIEFTRALGHALRRPAIFPVPPIAIRLLFGRGIANEMLLVSQRAVPRRLTDAGFRFRHATIEDALDAEFGRGARGGAAAR